MLLINGLKCIPLNFVKRIPLISAHLLLSAGLLAVLHK